MHVGAALPTLTKSDSALLIQLKKMTMIWKEKMFES